MKIQKNQGCNMIPLQTEVKYRGSRKFFAAWWPLFEGPADLRHVCVHVLALTSLYDGALAMQIVFGDDL